MIKPFCLPTALWIAASCVPTVSDSTEVLPLGRHQIFLLDLSAAQGPVVETPQEQL